MALPLLAALARLGPAVARLAAGGGGGVTLTKAGVQSSGTLGGGGMNMSLLSNPAAYQQGGPSPSTPLPSTATPSGLQNLWGAAQEKLGGLRGGLNDMGFSGLPKAIQESIEKLRAWTDGLHSSNMQFAEFSASMSAVQAQAEMREFYLKKEQGDRRAGSAGFLAEQKGNLDKSLAPIENLWAKFENVVGGSLLYLLDQLLTPVTTIAEWLDSKTSDDGGGETIGAAEFLARIGAMEDEAVKRRPKRMR